MIQHQIFGHSVSFLKTSVSQCLKYDGVLISILGCVIFTLLSGKPAFEYTTMRDTYKRIVKLQYKIPDQLTPAGNFYSFIDKNFKLS